MTLWQPGAGTSSKGAQLVLMPMARSSAAVSWAAACAARAAFSRSPP